MATNLDKKIREMNQEILRLKTAHPIVSNMITFYGEYIWDGDWDNKTHIYEITYTIGDQPIMTWEAYPSRGWSLLFGEPSGNKQLMYDMDAAHTQGDTYALFSTRQIVSVRKIL